MLVKPTIFLPNGALSNLVKLSLKEQSKSAQNSPQFLGQTWSMHWSNLRSTLQSNRPELINFHATKLGFPNSDSVPKVEVKICELTQGQRYCRSPKTVQKLQRHFHMCGGERMSSWVCTNQWEGERMWDEMMSKWGLTLSFLYPSMRGGDTSFGACEPTLQFWPTLTICTCVRNKFKIQLLHLFERGMQSGFWP